MLLHEKVEEKTLQLTLIHMLFHEDKQPELTVKLDTRKNNKWP